VELLVASAIGGKTGNLPTLSIERRICISPLAVSDCPSRCSRSASRLSWLAKEGQEESGEGNACRFFCCAKDQHWIRYLRKRGRFIISPTGLTPISLLKRLSTKLRTDSSSGPA